MSNRICIFPEDESTHFLVPLYDKLCYVGFEGFHTDTIKQKAVVLQAIEKAEFISFLGHGTSYSLLGTPVDGEKTDLICNDNVDLLKNKSLLLLSCRSNEFCRSYDLKDSIGFGIMPTGMDDVHSMMENDVTFPIFEQRDIDSYNAAIVNALITAIDLTSIDKLPQLYDKIRLCINIEIVDCLTRKSTPKYRDVADLLQDMKNDCTYIP